MLPFNVKKTFSAASRHAAGYIIELLAMLIFTLPLSFIIGVLITEFINK